MTVKNQGRIPEAIGKDDAFCRTKRYPPGGVSEEKVLEVGQRNFYEIPTTLAAQENQASLIFRYSRSRVPNLRFASACKQRNGPS